MEHAPSDLLLTSAAARLLGVSSQTIRAWDRLGRLTPALRTASGVRLYARAELETMRCLLDAQRHSETPRPAA